MNHQSHVYESIRGSHTRQGSKVENAWKHGPECEEHNPIYVYIYILYYVYHILYFTYYILYIVYYILYMYIWIYVYMHICIYAYMYICIYVYMYICIYVFHNGWSCWQPQTKHSVFRGSINIPSRGCRMCIAMARSPSQFFIQQPCTRQMPFPATARILKSDPLTSWQ